MSTENSATRHFLAWRAFMVGVLILLLQVPIGLTWGLIGERDATRREALADIGEKWGASQSIAGPVLIVPYRKVWLEQKSDGTTETKSVISPAFFLPEILQVEARIESEYRYRGIFEIPVYQMVLEVDGEFLHPDLARLGIDPSRALWERALLSLWVSDPHAIRDEVAMSWNAARLMFQPGSSEWVSSAGIHLPLRGQLDAERYTFSSRLALNGTQGAFFAPVGERTVVRMASNWEQPSFQGTWLPSSREVRADGFDAVWEIPFIGRNYPQQWTAETENLEARVRDSNFGVQLLSPVDPYRMAERSLKYEILFLFLTFLVVGLIEVLSGCRIHWVQYALIGAALCVFYLLELSLSEHLGFLPAYLLASGGVVGLICAYSFSILGSRAQGFIVGASVAVLYGYLYVLLQNQDYALLIGSLGIFAILGTIMYLTRKLDWSRF